ncbi:MAG: isoprenylcysteine carboxylmethyltransferase family protein [Phycisphaerae bacterium]|nr:isoprenylcysteine carboxylmethyltransferase family protein [Phycisphaerae bacterium]
MGDLNPSAQPIAEPQESTSLWGAKFAPRGLLRDGLIIASLVLADMKPSWLIAGLAVFILGALLHFWSKGCLVRNQVVTQVGPYRLVRHPFYLANFIIDLGICLISGSPWVTALYLPAFLLTYIPVIRREENYLRSQHGPAYDAYARQVPMLIPWKINCLFGPLDSTWNNIRRENEIPRLMRILAVPCYILAADMILHHDLLGRFSLPVLLAAVAGAVFFNVGSIVVRKAWRIRATEIFPLDA